VSSTEVADLIADLRSGRMRLEEVAARFRQRTWPSTRRPRPASYAQMADQQDPEADLPGSFDDVTAVYDRGEITREQYRALAHAAAESINAMQRHVAGEQPDLAVSVAARPRPARGQRPGRPRR
jgi:hypothetical protein